jgi:polysaccharide export outer membrane protein
MISITLRLVVSSLAICFLTDCSSSKTNHDEFDQSLMPTAPQGAGIGKPDYRLQTGDNIDLFVLEDNSFNGSYPVRASGDVILPKLGRVSVVGKTLTEAEQSLKLALQQTNLRQATVILDPGQRNLQTPSQEIVVRLAGSVAKTGRVAIPKLNETPITAYQAVVDVGGFTPFANKRKSYLIRSSSSGTRRLELDFDKIERGVAPDVPVQNGDSIVVPQKKFGF